MCSLGFVPGVEVPAFAVVGDALWRDGAFGVFVGGACVYLILSCLRWSVAEVAI